MITFGQRAKALREERKFSEEDAAKMLNWDESAILSLESDAFYLNTERLLLLANYLFKMPVLELCLGTDKEEEIRKTRMYPVHCANHDSLIFYPRQLQRREVKFCQECGDELDRRTCPDCHNPIEMFWGQYCGCCGRDLDLGLWEEAYGEALYRWAGEDLCEAATFDLHFFDESVISTRHTDYNLLICRGNVDHSTWGRGVYRFGFTTTQTHCSICGDGLISRCPGCDGKIISGRYCGFCGIDYFDGCPAAIDEYARMSEQSGIRPIWEVVDSMCLDLRITNTGELDHQELKKLISEFLKAGQINKDLTSALEFLRKEPGAILHAGLDNPRQGYLGLNRWCHTSAGRYRKGRDAARKLWGFLFSEESPSELVQAMDNRLLKPNMEAIENWLAVITSGPSENSDTAEGGIQ